MEHREKVYALKKPGWFFLPANPAIISSSSGSTNGAQVTLEAVHFFIGVGIVTYALKPEMMMERGLQSTAVTLTSHVMVELSLGWIFIFLGVRKESGLHPSSGA